jgi:hypothetical protein
MPNEPPVTTDSHIPAMHRNELHRVFARENYTTVIQFNIARLDKFELEYFSDTVITPFPAPPATKA